MGRIFGKMDRQTLSFKSVNESQGQVECEQARVFSTLDLLGLQLTVAQQEIAAFSFSGLGQF